MKISDCMKRRVISTSPNISILAAAHLMIRHHIGTLPIVDDSSCMLGFVRIRDLIALAMPDFVHLLENVDFVRDFGALEEEQPSPEILELPIRRIMSEPVYVEETAGLLRAIALLQEHKMSDLPVVDRAKHLVGIASYVDIGTALISNWNGSG